MYIAQICICKQQVQKYNIGKEFEVEKKSHTQLHCWSC